MGRKRGKMDLVSKSNNISFKKRKDCLIRKTKELCTLCDVNVCIVIYGPHDTCSTPDIWPPNLDEIRRIVEVYKAKKTDSRHKKFEMRDYFHAKKMQIEKEVSKLREKKMEAKYPTPVEMLSVMSEPELREFGMELRSRVEYVRSRIEVLRRSSNILQGGSTPFNDFGDSRFIPGLMPSLNLHYDHTMNEHINDQLAFGGSGSMDFCELMSMVNEDDQFGFGGAPAASFLYEGPSSSSTGVDPSLNLHYDHTMNEHINDQLAFGGSGSMDFCELMSMVNEDDQFGFGGAPAASFLYEGPSSSSTGVDPASCHNPWPSINNYEPSPACHMVVPPQLDFSTGWVNNDGEHSLEEIINYHMGFR